MIALTLTEIAEATGGRVVGPDQRVRAHGVATDSRRVAPGDLFVGLRGASVDGATFASSAVRAGAVAVMVAPGAAGAVEPRVEVEDPLAALAAVASAVRARSRARTVGITGSSGKTTTKDLLRSVLAAGRRVVANEASLNTEVGLPLTVARLEADTDVLVVELGARGVGHIRDLCRVARPDIGVVLNVGVAHIGMFGSRAAIAAAKAELVEALPPTGHAVLNADDPLVLAMASATAAPVLLFGLGPDAAVRAEGIELDADAHATFRLVLPSGRATTRLPAPGAHLVPDALAAAGAAWLLGLDPAEIAGGLAAATLSPMRMQVARRDDGLVVVDDAYNANPASVEAALRTLVTLRRPGGRVVAVLGEMAELGALSEGEHAAVGRLVAGLGVDRLVGVGELAAVSVAAARGAGMPPGQALAVPDPTAALSACADLTAPDVVLVKASRAVGLEVLAAALRDGGGSGGVRTAAGRRERGDGAQVGARSW